MQARRGVSGTDGSRNHAAANGPARVPNQPEKYERAAVRWHVRFAQEVPHVDLRESLAVLALLTAIPANRLAAAALAELLSRQRSCERIAEALVSWSRAA